MRAENVDIANMVKQVCNFYGQTDIGHSISAMLETDQTNYYFLVSESDHALLKAKDAYIDGSFDNMRFKEFESTDVSMFTIQLSHVDNESIVGNIAEVYYDQFSNLVKENEQPIQRVIVNKNGTYETFNIDNTSNNEMQLPDLARYNVVESISANDGNINAAIEYINALVNSQIEPVSEATFLSNIQEQTIIKQKIEVIIIKPKSQPYVDHIANDIREFQKQVDGFIRSIPDAVDRHSVIICNDNDKRYNFKPNRRINGEIIHGTIVIAGFDNETGEFTSLSQDQQKQYVDKYRDQSKDTLRLCDGRKIRDQRKEIQYER